MARLGIEHLGVEIVEEFSVQRLDGGAKVLARDDEAEVQRRRALRDHADVDLTKRLKDARGNAGGRTDIVADNANDGLIAIDVHRREFREMAHNLIEALAVLIDRQRDTYLGSGDHVDRSLISIEDFEDAAEETVRHEHSRGAD